MAEIPETVSHYYDGEGYNIEFVIESVDGVIIPENINDDEENSGDQEKNRVDNSKKDDSKKDELTKPTENASSNGGNELSSKAAEGVRSALVDHEIMNIGSMAISYSLNSNSPFCVLDNDRSCKSAPNKKRWADWVEEDEEEPAYSAPPKVCRKSTTDACKNSKFNEPSFSLPHEEKAAPAAALSDLLSRQESFVVEVGIVGAGSATAAEVAFTSLPWQEAASVVKLGCVEKEGPFDAGAANRVLDDDVVQTPS
jgi:hypothetical protein